MKWHVTALTKGKDGAVKIMVELRGSEPQPVDLEDVGDVARQAYRLTYGSDARGKPHVSMKNVPDHG